MIIDSEKLNGAVKSLLTRREVAERLGVCTETIKRYGRHGVLTPIVISRNLVRYHPEEIENLIRDSGGRIPQEEPIVEPEVKPEPPHVKIAQPEPASVQRKRGRPRKIKSPEEERASKERRRAAINASTKRWRERKDIWSNPSAAKFLGTIKEISQTLLLMVEEIEAAIDEAEGRQS